MYEIRGYTFSVFIDGPTQGHVVYELRAADGTQLYIGSSARVTDRIKEHKWEWIKWHRKEQGEVRAFTYGPFETRLAAKRHENYLISRLRPERNRQAA